jgi:hypothetical protein
MRTRPSRLRAVLAAASAAAAIAAVAGCSAQSSTASSPATLSTVHGLRPHRTHTSSATSSPRTRTSGPGAPVASTDSSASTLVRATPAQAANSSAAAAVCVTSAKMGHCQFGRYRDITGASTDPYVDQNVWSPIQRWHQKLHAYSPGRWRVAASMPAGNTAVVSFPNTGFFYNKALSRFSSIVSSFNVSIPGRAGTDAEASYDIWFNKTGAINEVMIQNDYSPGRSPSCGTWTAKEVRFGGSNGVRAHRWDLCVSGSTAYWETASGNMPSGKVNVLAMLKWLVSHGQLPGGVQLAGFSYGFEISSTGGARELFRVHSFSAAAH